MVLINDKIDFECKYLIIIRLLQIQQKLLICVVIFYSIIKWLVGMLMPVGTQQKMKHVAYI